MLKVPPPSLVAQTGQEEVQIRKTQLAGDKTTINFCFSLTPLFALAENDIRVPHIHVIEILVIDRHCN